MPELFHIAPASVRSVWLYIPLAIAILAVGFGGTVAVASLRGAHASTFELSDAGLRLRGDLYGRLIPRSHLIPASARRVDISRGPLQPMARTMGTALPGYRAGWFRLANGEKALLYVTDPTRVVQVPTTDGYSVLLSVAEADRFLERLQAEGSR